MFDDVVGSVVGDVVGSVAGDVGDSVVGDVGGSVVGNRDSRAQSGASQREDELGELHLDVTNREGRRRTELVAGVLKRSGRQDTSSRVFGEEWNVEGVTKVWESSRMDYS